jgi:type I restriction enzyme R subunit
MSPSEYSEDQLVEKPAIQLFGGLGWQTVSAEEEVFGATGTLSRETPSEVVLSFHLKTSLEKLNPKLPPEAIKTAIEELSKDRSAMLPASANREVWKLLRDGVKVSVPDRVRGGQKTETVRIIDWEKPLQNDFLLVSQFTVTGPLYTRRPDLVGFVNGLPLVVIELKKPGVAVKTAFDENLTCYKTDIPHLFWSNALFIVSNGTDSRVGSITADWERFFEWKRIEKENEPRRVSLEVMIRGVCEPNRLLDLVENFTLFSEHKSGLVKVLGQNHQYLGVNNAIQAAMKARELGHGRGGVFWQTQGSGKSFSMVFFAQKILRKIPGNWTFVVVTDRVELDDQIAKTFAACGAVVDANECHAQSGVHLRELLAGNHRYVFTLIHKFQSPDVLCNRKDVVVLTDEAHRSQYDTMAMNMRSALPNALFLAFTGTPLMMTGEERTREVFGDYVSVYDFQQSVEDGATVPLYYENRTPELHLDNPDLNEDIYKLIEETDLDPAQEERLERELSRQYHIITREDRLETIAKDIVQHFLGRGFAGKAMVVSIDKATALKMYDKVKKYWLAEKAKVTKELGKYDLASEAQAALRERLRRLTETDMALIVSAEQNEIEKMRRLGLDIVPHRKRMNNEELDEKFKDPTDPLGLVFVCAMWLTGFDAPSCSTVYLDKPMRNHTLMQTIARANRVFPGKHSGVIVDYANVFANLEMALAIYGKGTSGERPVKDKSALVGELKKAVESAEAFCKTHNVDILEIANLQVGSVAKLTAVGEAVNELISPDSIRKDFLALERLARVLYDAIKPDPGVILYSSQVGCLGVIANEIRLRTGEGPADITGIMAGISDLLDKSISAQGFVINAVPEGGDNLGSRPGVIDLSKIDFAALAKKFKHSSKKNLDLEVLKAAIRAQLDKLIRLNKSRVDYLQKFEELIESYNAGSRNIEELFQQLLNLSQSLNDEQQRHVRENLSEEELTVFDLLTRPGPDLTIEERAEVKKVAHLLLAKVKELLVGNWRMKVQARAKVRLAIEDTLDNLPRAYTKELFKGKCNVLFEHVYENYYGENQSTYASVG